MMTQVEAGALASGRAAEPERLGAALVAALELALVAAHRLLGELDRAAGRHADAAAHLARARALAGPVPPDVPPTPDRAEWCGPSGEPPACRAGLTRREREVLRLIAQGRSNREIAAALHLSPRTAERHAANLYPKIGAHSKAEAAAYALRHGLA